MTNINITNIATCNPRHIKKALIDVANEYAPTCEIGKVYGSRVQFNLNYPGKTQTVSCWWTVTGEKDSWVAFVNDGDSMNEERIDYVVLHKYGTTKVFRVNNDFSWYEVKKDHAGATLSKSNYVQVTTHFVNRAYGLAQV
jgi:hypothetical protein